MRVLGIETSCDETSAAVVIRSADQVTLDGLAILSQDVHRIFGGVVPELASRAHLVAIGAVVDDALRQAHLTIADIDGVAVTRGPGLLGALLVGVTWAKTVAWREQLPLIGVHHLEGHLFAPTLEAHVAPPFTALLVSGGHTLLLDVADWGDYRLLGQTRDDAAGEAFDKVGAMLGLDYPAGAAIERLAREGSTARFRFPRPLLRRGDLEFSFSGLKTAVARAVEHSDDVARDRADLARGFQDAVIEVLVTKTTAAASADGRERIVIGGGVACNQALIAAMRAAAAPSTRVLVASPRLNTDNAAMIAAAGSWRLARGEHDGFDLDARATLPLPGLHLPEGAVA
jgi:N6-L-threonylcarbamoyladenine synthase